MAKVPPITPLFERSQNNGDAMPPPEEDPDIPDTLAPVQAPKTYATPFTKALKGMQSWELEVCDSN